LNFHEWKDITLDVIKSRSVKEAYAMMFTSPSKLAQVKEEFNDVYLRKQEALIHADASFIEINTTKK
jgi:hypothetical protein